MGAGEPRNTGGNFRLGGTTIHSIDSIAYHAKGTTERPGTGPNATDRGQRTK
jgi:hypothetical protein